MEQMIGYSCSNALIKRLFHVETATRNSFKISGLLLFKALHLFGSNQFTIYKK